MFKAYFDNNFKLALQIAEEQLTHTKDETQALRLRNYIGLFTNALDPVAGERLLRSLMLPTNPSAYIWLSIGESDKGLPADSLQTLNEGIAATADIGLIRQKARALGSVGRQADALTLLEETSLRDDADASTFQALAEAYVTAGRLDDARKWLDKGVLRFPKSKDLYRTYAKLLEDHFDKKLALLPYNAWLEEHPTYQEALSSSRNNIF